MEIDRQALDRYLTGNWGEDQNQDDEDARPTEVYVDYSDWTNLCLRHAQSGERMSDRPETLVHNLIELANANGWDIVSGPRPAQPEEDCPDDDPGFDPMFLM